MIDKELHKSLLEAADAGRVYRRTRDGLAIYNYTPETMRKRDWTPVTLLARGLIIEEATSRIVARPFPKFFNLNETPETMEDVLQWDMPHYVTEKMDGSLGIIFWHDGKWDIATRGSFESPQAIFAREHLLRLYDLDMIAGTQGDATILTEIIYPGSRQVVDYGDACALVYLGAMWVDGRTAGGRRKAEFAGMEVAPEYPSTEFAAIREENRPNTEGVVLHWPHNGLRVKFKTADYVAAHRCLSEIRPRRVLELLVEGRDDDVLAQLPPHIRETFIEIREDLAHQISEVRVTTDDHG